MDSCTAGCRVGEAHRGLDSHRAYGASHFHPKGGGVAVPSIEGVPAFGTPFTQRGDTNGWRWDDLERQVKGAIDVTQTTRKRHKLRGQRGQTMVEFAIVLPIFLMLLLGIAQLGIAFNNYVTLTDGVRAGARYGAVLRTVGTRNSDTINKVKQSSANLNQSNINVTVTSTWTAGSDLTVCGTYPYSINLIGLVVASGNLNSCTTNRVE